MIPSFWLAISIVFSKSVLHSNFANVNIPLTSSWGLIINLTFYKKFQWGNVQSKRCLKSLVTNTSTNIVNYWRIGRVLIIRNFEIILGYTVHVSFITYNSSMTFNMKMKIS